MMKMKSADTGWEVTAVEAKKTADTNMRELKNVLMVMTADFGHVVDTPIAMKKKVLDSVITRITAEELIADSNTIKWILF